METIKFIVEVDKQYIYDMADPEKASERVVCGDKDNAMRALADMISFGAVKKEIESGATEFVIDKEQCDDNSGKLFSNTVSHLSMLAGLFAIKKSAEKEE